MNDTSIRHADLAGVIQINPDDIHLASGSHSPIDPPNCGKTTEACLFEWYNALLGRRWGDDCPPGVSIVLHQFGIRLNDALPDDRRQELKAFLPKPGQPSPLDGTADDGLDERRRWMAADWAVRTATPMWLDAAGKADFAAELRAMAPITSRDDRLAVRGRLWEIRDACWAARREALKQVRERSADAVAVADADADAVADAVAAAAADAVAAAVADAAAVAAAVAAAAAAAAAVADAAAAADRWSDTYNRVYRDIYDRIRARYAPVEAEVHDSAIALFHRMVKPTA